MLDIKIIFEIIKPIKHLISRTFSKDFHAFFSYSVFILRRIMSLILMHISFVFVNYFFIILLKVLNIFYVALRLFYLIIKTTTHTKLKN